MEPGRSQAAAHRVVVQPHHSLYNVPRKRRSALVRQEETFYDTRQHHVTYHTAAATDEESADSEREHEVAEVLFDLANMVAAPVKEEIDAHEADEEPDAVRAHSHAHAGPRHSPDRGSTPCTGQYRNGKRKVQQSPAVARGAQSAWKQADSATDRQNGRQVSRFAKRCASHVYIASFIKLQQEEDHASKQKAAKSAGQAAAPATSDAGEQPHTSVPATADSGATVTVAQHSNMTPLDSLAGHLPQLMPPMGASPMIPDWRGTLPPMPPFASTAYSLPPLTAAGPPGGPPLLPLPGQLPPGQPLPGLLAPPGFFFSHGPPGPFPPGAPPPPFVPGAGATPLSIFGPPGPPFLAAFPAALQQLAGDPALIAASLAQGVAMPPPGVPTPLDLGPKTEAIMSAAMLSATNGLRPFQPTALPQGRWSTVPGSST